MIQWLRYVPHGQVLSFLAKGWNIADDLVGTNHGHYAVLMIWGGVDEPPR